MNTKNAVLAFALCFGLGAVGSSAQAPGSEQKKPAVAPKPAVATAPLPGNTPKKKIAEAPKPPAVAAPLPGAKVAQDKAMVMSAQCAMMQSDMEKMDKDMQQGQQKLQQLLGTMNAAPAGPERVDSLVAVINEMAAQSNAMHTMHSDMMQKMMQHMSEHMMEGAGPKAHDDMMKCPMMQDHAGAEHGKPAPEAKPGDVPTTLPGTPQVGGDHADHHPPAKQ